MRRIGAKKMIAGEVADVGQIANLPRFRQVRNLPHVADFLRRATRSDALPPFA